MGRLWKTINGKRVRTAAGYEHEYAKWGGTTKYKKDRASRNKARRELEREGRVHKGDGNSVDHKDSNPRDDAESNLRVMTKRANAARKEDSRRKGSSRNKARWGE